MWKASHRLPPTKVYIPIGNCGNMESRDVKNQRVGLLCQQPPGKQ